MSNYSKIYKKAIEVWGEESQIDMLQEECLELALAIRKYRRNPSSKTYENMCEELADVTIMVEQMEHVGNLMDDVEPHKLSKTIRLNQRLEDE